MYAVTGVGGYVGAQTARRLMERVPASQIIVTSRNEKALAEWRAKGARAYKADYDDKAALIEAWRGVEAVFMVSAMQASNGFTSSNTATSPPINSARLPVIACSTLRVTGESIMRTPRASNFPPTRRVVAGSMVLMSM